jgi:hypothetical protein
MMLAASTLQLRMLRKLRIGNEAVGIVPVRIWAAIQYLPGGTKEKHENPHLDDPISGLIF